ncbi:tRNA (adenosine(37)-N6)-dimethylallyltransferase MiaA [Robertkochia marina]|uniref:tRNA dimethylallyltransferase n=1 Tax=Robertkochia marina TaxID=1227945 RepID=A0A4S3M071_9FLAO|nr:tRNA (adenosine(37)-N6)-dimethylallyltransferase MiaA [Robertkochia marina]THD67792.1 tRNA (adenosine(37)-N6)-dimethylallyltransferase MiaA [Robertkochia marina]TRZ41733.1 tRNA (adenosine(37)-N6)-dimethylallyltransferase MiaA [Robertkochia marina]
MSHNYLISVAGPTAIGKTAMAIHLAKHFNTEIISSDSRQFFKEMSVGTAVPDPDELKAARHHFIQHISIHENYSVGDFERDTLKRLDALYKDHTCVIMAGGSGLYSDAVIKGMDHFPDIDPEIREKLNELFTAQGLEALQQLLKEKDPDYYKKVDTNNPHRLIRALEVCLGTEKPFSSFLNQPREKRPFNTIKVGITADRKIIYDRINLRVDMMMEAGLLEEAERLFPYRELNALQTVGYKELFEYMDGKATLEEAVSEIKKNTRRFAKRQLTWLRKDPDINWFEYDTDPQEVCMAVEGMMDY